MTQKIFKSDRHFSNEIHVFYFYLLEVPINSIFDTWKLDFIAVRIVRFQKFFKFPVFNLYEFEWQILELTYPNPSWWHRLQLAQFLALPFSRLLFVLNCGSQKQGNEINNNLESCWSWIKNRVWQTRVQSSLWIIHRRFWFLHWC